MPYVSCIFKVSSVTNAGKPFKPRMLYNNVKAQTPQMSMERQLAVLLPTAETSQLKQ